MSNSQRVLVLVGLPGSGKSTFSTALAQHIPHWQRVNQDTLRSRKNCEIHAYKYLKNKDSVVIDRCNFDENQRRTWIKMAQDFDIPVDCIIFTADKETCSSRILNREDHPTGVTGRHGVSILNRFVSNYVLPDPEKAEGFRHILTVDPNPEPVYTAERVREILRELDKSPNLLA